MFWVFGCLGVLVFWCFGVLVFGCLGVWVFGCLGCTRAPVRKKKEEKKKGKKKKIKKKEKKKKKRKRKKVQRKIGAKIDRFSGEGGRFRSKSRLYRKIGVCLRHQPSNLRNEKFFSTLERQCT